MRQEGQPEGEKGKLSPEKRKGCLNALIGQIQNSLESVRWATGEGLGSVTVGSTVSLESTAIKHAFNRVKKVIGPLDINFPIDPPVIEEDGEGGYQFSPIRETEYKPIKNVNILDGNLSNSSVEVTLIDKHGTTVTVSYEVLYHAEIHQE